MSGNRPRAYPGIGGIEEGANERRLLAHNIHEISIADDDVPHRDIRIGSRMNFTGIPMEAKRWPR